VKDSIDQFNNLPCNNYSDKVFGRNITVQEIVVNLDYDNEKTKLIHIYGKKGVGKSAISIHAAKYAFDRRFFPNGAYYVDF
jgi:hypothetical protein